MGGESKSNSGSATAVLLDRSDDQGVILRFLLSDVSWDVHTREIRLSSDLAEQLMKMLEAELDQDEPGYQYELKQRFAV